MFVVSTGVLVVSAGNTKLLFLCVFFALLNNAYLCVHIFVTNIPMPILPSATLPIKVNYYCDDINQYY